MRHLRSTLLLLALAAPACAVTVKDGKAKLGASMDANALDLDAFGRWDRERQAKIRARCRQDNVGAKECTRRLNGYQETRDHVLGLLKKQLVSLELAVTLAGRDPDGSPYAEGSVP